MACLDRPWGVGNWTARRRLNRNCVFPLPLSPVTSVTYPVGIPPSSRASMAGSSVLIEFHRDNTTRFNGPGTSFSSKLSSAPTSPFPFLSVWKPTSRCSASTICAARRRTSAGGTWARFAISSVSRVIRSAVLMLFRSREGRICAYGFVEKEGRVDRRSMCGREKLRGEVAAELCARFCAATEYSYTGQFSRTKNFYGCFFFPDCHFAGYTIACTWTMSAHSTRTTDDYH